jgi:hypothetical protein
MARARLFNRHSLSHLSKVSGQLHTRTKSAAILSGNLSVSAAAGASQAGTTAISPQTPARRVSVDATLLNNSTAHSPASATTVPSMHLALAVGSVVSTPRTSVGSLGCFMTTPCARQTIVLTGGDGESCDKEIETQMVHEDPNEELSSTIFNLFIPIISDFVTAEIVCDIFDSYMFSLEIYDSLKLARSRLASVNPVDSEIVVPPPISRRLTLLGGNKELQTDTEQHDSDRPAVALSR